MRVATLGLALTLVTCVPVRAQAPWRVLFDGTSLDAFRGYGSDTVPTGWAIVNGTLAKSGATAELITRNQFGDFELIVEWKIATGGDSGIFYRATEAEDKIWWTGPEYQLLDDDNADDNKTRLTCAGADTGLYPSPAGHLKPVGEWNTTRILVRGSHVEHWLNEFKLLEYELGSPDWTARVNASKFAKWPRYGREPKGHIGFQGSHDDGLALRNIRIREIP